MLPYRICFNCYYFVSDDAKLKQHFIQTNK
nr:MAG TPA: Ribosomal L32p protein family [Caudoviricetes sp.]